jgi:hypothetical protein
MSAIVFRPAFAYACDPILKAATSRLWMDGEQAVLTTTFDCPKKSTTLSAMAGILSVLAVPLLLAILSGGRWGLD